MASALDEFRAQREAADAIHARLEETTALLRSVLAETQTLAHSEALRTLLRDEQTWLVRAEQVITTMRHQREWEVRRFWPAVWRRWVVAVMFAVVTTGAASAGYVWAARPDAAELADLRARMDGLDVIAERVLTMTPAERRQFDALMKGTGVLK